MSGRILSSSLQEAVNCKPFLTDFTVTALLQTHII